MQTIRMLKLFLICVTFAGSISFASAQEKPTVKDFGAATPKSIAFIGNSFFYFNNGITSHLAPMVSESLKGHPLRATMITMGGSGFDWHDVESYFRPNAIGKYSFDAQNNVVFNQSTGPLFEASVMMDCSQCPIHPTLKPVFYDYAKKHSDTVRKHGSKPIFFMSWAYQDKPEMTQALADAYTQAGNANNALVIPVGLAFAKSVAIKPEVNLYAPDKRHPSVEGTYLAAATTFATLYNKSPVGIKFTAGLKTDVAAHLQQVAFETVNAYLNR